MWITAIVLIGCGLVLGQRFDYSRHSIWELTIANENQLLALKSIQESELKVDFLHFVHGVGANASVLVAPEAEHLLLSILDDFQVQRRKTVANVQQIVDEEQIAIEARNTLFNTANLAAFDFENYHNYAEIVSYLDGLAETCGSLCTVDSFGSSLQNRLMKYIRIAADTTDSNVVFIEAGVHAREWISPAVALNLINTLITGYNTNPNVTSLVKNFQWYIVPVTNPDGYEHSYSNERYWRKNRRPGKSPSGLNCYGVDLNRNFDYKWGASGTSVSCLTDIYRGPLPFSEPETQNLRDLVRPLAGKMKAYFSLHSFGQYWMLPFAYKILTYPDNYTHLLRIGRAGAAAIKAVDGSIFLVGSAADVLYEAAGTSFDWAASLNVTYSYCLELRPRGLGASGFNLHPSKIDPASRETIAGIFAALKLM